MAILNSYVSLPEGNGDKLDQFDHAPTATLLEWYR